MSKWQPWLEHIVVGSVIWVRDWYFKRVNGAVVAIGRCDDMQLTTSAIKFAESNCIHCEDGKEYFLIPFEKHPDFHNMSFEWRF